MNITKAQARTALGFIRDVELAVFFGISRAAVSNWPEDKPLPDGRQWELRAKRPDLFPAEQESGKGEA
jgi:DNA-binding transcriptional regulator YiaG